MMKESIDASEWILKGLPNWVKSPEENHRAVTSLADKIWGPILRKI